ncbi:MAG: site-specific DNA-methyltransferase [Sedimentisphaerales bacterium]|nr:site-specific DNA-methyltransferase [Sedimentisphaerales bacterium]
MAKKKNGRQVPIESVKHKDKRKNIPTEELRGFVKEDEIKPKEVKYSGLLYARDPSIDPQLVWKGKDEQDKSELAVPSVPIYIQEKIKPQAIIEDIREQAKKGKPQQLDFFSDFNGIPSLEQMVEFYQHDANWSNRMILGDSLLVMTSLAEKEGLKGQVQMIYIDPPYGIRFGSNWQVSTRKRDVKDGKAEDLTRQPEQIRAFRDTWELGIHSYLAYWRDRLIVARDLLTETGSIFIQIGDENVHLVRCLMDEVFGVENCISLITFRTTAPLGEKYLPAISNWLIWYGKDKTQTKFRQLSEEKRLGEGTNYSWIERQDGFRRRMTETERKTPDLINPDLKIFYPSDLLSSGYTESCTYDFELEGRINKARAKSWRTHETGMKRLILSNRLMYSIDRPCYIAYHQDYPYQPLSNLWDTTRSSLEKIFVVQTDTEIIQRCILLSTDPGDLVLDPTCGGGTTGFVAEEWGRRWITIDTSRVAIALARTRLMTGRFAYYVLSDSPEGVKKESEITGLVPTSYQTGGDIKKGFVYKRVPHITLKAIANNEQIDAIYARYQEKMEPVRGETNKLLGTKWEEWEIPRELEDGRQKTEDGKKAKELLKEWWELRQKRQKEIDDSIAQNADVELLFDQPYEDNKRIRVTGPFTVESLSPHRTISFEEKKELMQPNEIGFATKMLGAGQFGNIIIENLKKAGVQNTIKNERLKFDRLDVHAGVWIHAVGEYTESGGKSRCVAVCIGPEHGTVGPDLVREAAKEAVQGIGYDLLLVCGFAFDPHVNEEAKRYGKLTVLPTRINADLQMGDDFLKKTGAGNLFMVFGEPDLEVRKVKDGKLQVEIRGLDIYDPTTGQIRNNSTDDIACWFIDTNYNEESFFVRHAYFTGADQPYERLKRALRAEIDESAWSMLYSTKSRPFDKPETGKIAVKVINHYGDEVLKVYTVK